MKTLIAENLADPSVDILKTIADLVAREPGGKIGLVITPEALLKLRRVYQEEKLPENKLYWLDEDLLDQKLGIKVPEADKKTFASFKKKLLDLSFPFKQHWTKILQWADKQGVPIEGVGVSNYPKIHKPFLEMLRAETSGNLKADLKGTKNWLHWLQVESEIDVQRIVQRVIKRSCSWIVLDLHFVSRFHAAFNAKGVDARILVGGKEVAAKTFAPPPKEVAWPKILKAEHRLKKVLLKIKKAARH